MPGQCREFGPEQPFDLVPASVTEFVAHAMMNDMTSHSAQHL